MQALIERRHTLQILSHFAPSVVQPAVAIKLKKLISRQTSYVLNGMVRPLRHQLTWHRVATKELNHDHRHDRH